MIFDCSCEGGLGASIPAIIAGGGQIAAAVVPSALISSGAIAAGSLAVPVIGAAIAGVTLAVSLFLNRNAAYFAEEKATTDIVNQAEVLMKQNLQAWNSSDKYYSEQQQAITNFNNIWSQVVQNCSSPNYQQGSNQTGLSPGQRCISDRQRGGQWDWFSYYLDPIMGDPNVKADPSLPNTSAQNIVSNVGTDATNFISSVAGGSLGSMLPLLIAAGLGIWALKELS